MKLTIVLLLLATPAWAKGKPASRRAPPPATTVKPHAVPTPEATPTAPPPKAVKPRVYNFSGLDVEGKLKTPQLLYFFDRVKLELDTTTEPRRSFIKELEDSASDKGL
jgi:hypothetical protein